MDIKNLINYYMDLFLNESHYMIRYRDIISDINDLKLRKLQKDIEQYHFSHINMAVLKTIGLCLENFEGIDLEKINGFYGFNFKDKKSFEELRFSVFEQSKTQISKIIFDLIYDTDKLLIKPSPDYLNFIKNILSKERNSLLSNIENEILETSEDDHLIKLKFNFLCFNNIYRKYILGKDDNDLTPDLKFGLDDDEDASNDHIKLLFFTILLTNRVYFI